MLRGALLGRAILAALGAVALIGACSEASQTSSAPIKLPQRVEPEAGTDASADAPVESSAAVNPCANGRKDGAETDVDCGGAACPPCANGKICALRSDCTSLLCTGMTCSGDLGCSDGTREGFLSLVDFANIAACAGGWSLPGLISTTAPACGRDSGNGSANPTGAACNVADLCQPGWHVCVSGAEVATKSGAGVGGCAGAATAGSFFATRQSGAGAAKCGAAGANDFFGCGGVGGAPDGITCGPFDRYSNDLCGDLPIQWSCGANADEEANNVTKPTSDAGGVLCCRD